MEMLSLESGRRVAEMMAAAARGLHDLKLPITEIKFPNWAGYYISSMFGVLRDKPLGDDVSKSRYIEGLSGVCPELVDAPRDEIISRAREALPRLKCHTPVHGDFCLTNVFFSDDGWQMIDFPASGLGDRHIDLFWAIWSLWRNTGEPERCSLPGNRSSVPGCILPE